MSGSKHRKKGDRIERKIVELLRSEGIKAERYPLSGASRFRGKGHDLDIYAFCDDEAPLVAEVKSRKNGTGFAVIRKWLGDYDHLILDENFDEPLVVLPWRAFVRYITELKRRAR